MTTGTIVSDFPPNAPKRLIQALQQAGTERKLSKQLGVNILYVSQLLRKGVEPTDKTAKGRTVRVKLFLPKTKRKLRAMRPEEFPGQKRIKKGIRKMVKATKKAVIRHD